MTTSRRDGKRGGAHRKRDCKQHKTGCPYCIRSRLHKHAKRGAVTEKGHPRLREKSDDDA